MNIDFDTKETSYFIDAMCNHCKESTISSPAAETRCLKGNVLIKLILLHTLCADVKEK